MKRVRPAALIAVFAMPVLLLALVTSQPHTPPSRAVPFVRDPRVDRILHRSCGDCHSNETRWPWYSRVPPVSWLLRYDVKKGREHLNFSSGLRGNQASEILDRLDDASMPPRRYLWLHSDARLSDEDKDAITKALRLEPYSRNRP
ncbi:MAG: heme-binding domain-containing protein [Acidobacteriaceae bacterium]|nr:heme-binding domain-containing protein [Acidobacteriaceae bacterium]